METNQTANDLHRRDQRTTGRSLEVLTTQTSPLMPHIQEFDGDLLAIEESIQTSVPTTIRDRIRVTRNLAVYGAFCYDFFAVSVSWAYSTVEMALWTKFRQLNPENPTPPTTLRPLVQWATSRRLLPPHIPPVFIAPVRNLLMHPKASNEVHSPGMTRETFQMLVDVVNHLWPLETATQFVALSPDRITEPELVTAVRHLAFDVYYFRLYSRLIVDMGFMFSNPVTSQAVGYALLLHFRLLLDFFYTDPVKDDCCVSTFIDLSSEFKRNLPAVLRPSWLNQVQGQLNKRLAHMTATRWRERQPDMSCYSKHFAELDNMILAFTSALPANLRDEFDRKTQEFEAITSRTLPTK